MTKEPDLTWWMQKSFQGKGYVLELTYEGWAGSKKAKWGRKREGGWAEVAKAPWRE